MSGTRDLLAYLSAADDNSAFAVGVVSNVVPGAAADGNALVTVTWRGTQATATYGAHYTPNKNDVVLMARTTQRLVILMRLIGTPPTT